MNSRMRLVAALAAAVAVGRGFAADWTPALLGADIVKNWYDSDAANALWQDAGGTVPVTANPSCVGTTGAETVK